MTGEGVGDLGWRGGWDPVYFLSGILCSGCVRWYYIANLELAFRVLARIAGGGGEGMGRGELLAVGV